MRNRLARSIPAIIVAFLASAALVVAFIPAGASGPVQLVDYGSVSCSLDSGGRCTVQHHLGVVPASVVVSPNTPAGWNGFMLNTVRDSFTATTFQVRAMSTQTSPKNGGTIWFNYVAYGSSVAPPSTTEPPPSSSPPPVTTVPTTTLPVTTTTTAPPLPGDFPNASNTGAPSGTVFGTTISGNYTAATAGQTLDAWHITGVLFVEAANVTILRSQVDGGVRNFQAPSSSFTLTDSTVGPASGCSWGVTVWGNNYTALRVRSRNMDNGFSTDSGNLTIRDSFSTTCSPDSSAHADGFETCCDINAQYPNITLDHNTFDQRGATSATAPIDLAEALHVTNVKVTNNLVAGGAYSMYLESYTTSPKWTVSGNKWVDESWAFGPLTTDNTCGNIDWGPGNDIVTVDSDYRITSTVRPLACVD